MQVSTTYSDVVTWYRGVLGDHVRMAQAPAASGGGSGLYNATLPVANLTASLPGFINTTVRLAPAGAKADAAAVAVVGVVVGMGVVWCGGGEGS